MAILFTADTHFGHENIIKFCNRPFENVEEMDRVLAENWNHRVCANDDIYILGDFCYRNDVSQAIDLLKNLNGRKHLIAGNHDMKYLKNQEFREQFVEVEYMLTISVDNTRIVLCHYPIAEWDGFFRGTYHIYGHIHNAKNAAFHHLRSVEQALNAGCDITRFVPVSFEELKTYNDIFKQSK